MMQPSFRHQRHTFLGALLWTYIHDWACHDVAYRRLLQRSPHETILRTSSRSLSIPTSVSPSMIRSAPMFFSAIGFRASNIDAGVWSDLDRRIWATFSPAPPEISALSPPWLHLEGQSAPGQPGRMAGRCH